MSDPGEEQTPKAQSAFSGPPDRPRKTIYLLDPMVVRDLANALQLKPFKVVADLMEMKVLKFADDSVDFETASIIARKHGYRAEKPPPGMLIL